jgi:HTH-type transcriptional regulator / antitoxin HipB
MMSDFQDYKEKRFKKNPESFKSYDKDYKNFKMGALLKQARKEAGLTQEELAKRLNTKKSSISRIENHAEDMKISTIERFVEAVGKQFNMQIY